MSNTVKLVVSITLMLFALAGLASLAHCQSPLSIGPGHVGKMAAWEVATLTWKPWTLTGYGLTAQLYTGPDYVARMAYWNGTAWQAWTGTVPSTWMRGGNWKVFYTNGSGVFTELALGAANTYLRSNGPAIAPSFNAIPPVLDSIRMNPLGGLDVLMQNLSGATMYRGWLVEGRTGASRSTQPTVAGDINPIGTVYDASVASQDWYWMTVSGVGYVAVRDAPTSAVVNGDRVLAVAAAIANLADCYTLVGVPVHDREVGHPISNGIIGQNTSPTTDDICTAVIHFR